MKTTVIEAIEQNTEIKFPCLMHNPESGTLLLATSKCEKGYVGTIVYSSDPNTLELGKHGDYWCNQFVPFDGSVTLSND